MPSSSAERIGPGVLQLDTLLGGWERITAGYLIEGPRPVLVETGSQSSVRALLAALEELGVGAGDLAGVAVTHIHLDHAGGAGDVARAFPNATVYVHEKGARHLVDPTKLVNSAAMVYGDLLDSLYGRLDPTPAERLHVLADGEELPIGDGRMLTTVDSPGHAKHHLALHDSASGILFVGDAVGVRLPDAGVLRPSTPPPDFDLDQAVHSLHRFAERHPTGIALAPFQHLLVSACGKPIILSALTGHVFNVITQVGGGDEVWHNPGDERFYVTGASTIAPLVQSLGVIDAETSTWLQNVADIRGKNPAAFAETNHIFTIVQINAAIVAAPATDDSTCTQFGLRGRGCIAVFAHADEGDDEK